MQLIQNTYFGEGNRYYLEKLLGRGGFSEVWLAKDAITDLELALKVYVPGTGMDEDGLQTFSKELARVYHLNHPNLLRPQHVDSWQGMPYLLMAYCPQGSLVKRIGGMPETEIRKVLHDVASGLAYLHAHDVVHQDIKPDNILLDDAGNYVITDFGISARARSTLRKSVAASTAHSGGTIAYMGPERFGKEPAPFKASDVWSLGAMLYELMTGDTPFGEHGGLIQKSGAEIPSIQGNYSSELKQMVEQMLALNPWDRPTAEDLAAGYAVSSTPRAVASTIPMAYTKKLPRNYQETTKKEPAYAPIKFPMYANIALGIMMAVYVYCCVANVVLLFTDYDWYNREVELTSVEYLELLFEDTPNFPIYEECERHRRNAAGYEALIILAIWAFIAILLLGTIWMTKKRNILYIYMGSVVISMIPTFWIYAQYDVPERSYEWIVSYGVLLLVTLAIFYVKVKGKSVYSLLR